MPSYQQQKQRDRLNNRLWNDSVKLYQHENVKESCLYLQDHYCMNVTLFLSCIWYAQNGQAAITKVQFEKLIELLKPWEKKLTDQLRQLRLKISSHPSSPFEPLYEEISALEIFSEKIQFAIIYNYFIDLKIMRRRQPKAKQGIANLQNYFSLTKIALDEAGYEKVRTVLSEAFPDFIDHDFPQMSIPFVF